MENTTSPQVEEIKITPFLQSLMDQKIGEELYAAHKANDKDSERAVINKIGVLGYDAIKNNQITQDDFRTQIRLLAEAAGVGETDPKITDACVNTIMNKVEELQTIEQKPAERIGIQQADTREHLMRAVA